MIEFSCIYCGGMVEADVESAGKIVQCPACGHSVVVRFFITSDRLPVHSAVPRASWSLR